MQIKATISGMTHARPAQAMKVSSPAAQTNTAPHASEVKDDIEAQKMLEKRKLHAHMMQKNAGSADGATRAAMARLDQEARRAAAEMREAAPGSESDRSLRTRERPEESIRPQPVSTAKVAPPVNEGVSLSPAQKGKVQVKPAGPASVPADPSADVKPDVTPTPAQGGNSPLPGVSMPDAKIQAAADMVAGKDQVSAGDIQEALKLLQQAEGVNIGNVTDEMIASAMTGAQDAANAAAADGHSYELHVGGLLAYWGHSDSPYDLNGDGTVGVNDLLLLLANGGTMMGPPPTNLTLQGLLADWGKANSPFDLTGSGTVDVFDLLAFLGQSENDE